MNLSIASGAIVFTDKMISTSFRFPNIVPTPCSDLGLVAQSAASSGRQISARVFPRVLRYPWVGKGDAVTFEGDFLDGVRFGASGDLEEEGKGVIEW
jgi:hypothetical protein